MNLISKIGILLIFLVFCKMAWTNNDEVQESCVNGLVLVKNGQYAEAVSLLTQCINSKEITKELKRSAYYARAVSYHRLKKSAFAAEDMEAAFSLMPVDHPRRLLDYALYLRASGRVLDSLKAIEKVVGEEEQKGKITMPTQYHLGWTLQELGKHEEAINAFTNGLEYQPDYFGAHLRRGISLDALGRKLEARKDFEFVAENMKKIDVSKISEENMDLIKKMVK